MPLQEITEQQLRQRLHAMQGTEAVLFYTPLCGTCKLAERMLEVIQATSAALPLYKLNIHFAPELRSEWQIASVPCLVVLERQDIRAKVYALHSVDYIYHLLKQSSAGE